MAWWHRDKRLDAGWTSKVSEAPLPEILEAKPGEIIPCDDPKEVVIVPKDPEPDLFTKPKDVVGYCFGYVCPKKHVGEKFDNITVDSYKERRVCQTCGSVSKPAVVKRTAEARWGDVAYRGFVYDKQAEWGWYNSCTDSGRLGCWAPMNAYWTKHEFVHYLESPKRRKK